MSSNRVNGASCHLFIQWDTYCVSGTILITWDTPRNKTDKVKFVTWTPSMMEETMIYPLWNRHSCSNFHLLFLPIGF